MPEENTPKKKVKKVILSYNIDSFTTLTDYHQSKGISDAFLIATSCILILALMGYDTIIAAAFCLIMALMYRFYHFTLRGKLTTPEWKKSEIEEKKLEKTD